MFYIDANLFDTNYGNYVSKAEYDDYEKDMALQDEFIELAEMETLRWAVWEAKNRQA